MSPNLEKRVATINGPIGYVEVRDDQTVRLIIEEQWVSLFERINAALSKGKSFVGIDGSAQTIDGTNPNDLEGLRNVIRARSQGRLTFMPKEEHPD